MPQTNSLPLTQTVQADGTIYVGQALVGEEIIVKVPPTGIVKHGATVRESGTVAISKSYAHDQAHLTKLE